MKYALIVAGGAGTRMNSDIPKQFLLLKDLPVLMHTINAFFSYDAAIEVILVLPKNQVNTWNDLVTKYNFTIDIKVVIGGATRYDSVKNGLDVIKTKGLVAIHDGVRPLVTSDIIERCFKTAEQRGNAITSMNLKDSIRKFDANTNQSVPRSEYKIIQTPQTFDVDKIKFAYANVSNHPSLTDDASVLEKSGEKINLVDGAYSNIKITTPEDLKIANSLLG